MNNKQNPRTISTKKYQQKAGYVAKSYKLKKDVIEKFEQACKKYGISQAKQLTHMMLEFVALVESSSTTCRKDVNSMITPYSSKQYILIYPNEIGKVEKPPFGKYGRETEQEYRKLLEDSQEYFQQYINNPSTKSFFISDSCDAACLYLDLSQAVTVVKNKKGKYEVNSNGHHRMYVAKKYKLPLLVCYFGEYS